jgi:hypothetical protein
MSFTVTVTLESSTLSPLAVSNFTLENLSINYGRQRADSQPKGTSISLQFLRNDPVNGNIPAEYLDLGTTVTVQLLPTAFVNTYRFRGTITDLSIDQYLVTIIATDDLIATLGRFMISTSGDLNYTGDRIQEILDSLDFYGLPSPPYNLSPGTVFLTYSPIGTGNALTYIQSTANQEPSGVFFNSLLSQELRFTDSDDRRVVTPDLTIASTEILDNWVIRKTALDKINRFNVSNDLGEITFEDAADIVANGPYEQSLAGLFYDDADMELLAQRTVGNRANPNFTLDQIVLPMGTFTTARQNAILNLLEIGSMVRIPELIDDLGTDYFLEGYNETIRRNDWNVTLFLTDVRLTRPPQRWTDVGASVQWIDVDATITWASMVKEYV